MSKVSGLLLSVACAALTAFAAPAFAQENEADAVVVTGSRAANRTRLDTVAPVDVVSAATIANSGSTELNQTLANTLPSLDFPRPSITDGTDSVRPATLRGLAPDQTLVLINSKRAHASALININNSIGRGSAAVDMNTIPTAALGSVEVLRDGASAQYGSDAIAGVINLRLREAREGGGASVTYGQYLTTVETTHFKRDETDGATATVSGWVGLPLGPEGFLTITGEYLDRDPTSRGDADLRILGNTAYSPTGSVVTSRYGDPEVQQGTIFLNAGLPINANWELYGFGGYQRRDSSSAANARLPVTAGGNIFTGFTLTTPPAPNPGQVVLSITPQGYLPRIEPKITDVNAALGVRGKLAGWDADFSVSYGKNEIEFYTVNTLNASIAAAQTTPGLANNPYFGQTPKREFFAYGLEYDQTTANIDLTRTINEGGLVPFTIATGVEYRKEKFAETPGEYGSYGLALSTTGAPLFTGSTAPQGGSSGFVGNPASTNTDRHSFAAYAEADGQFTDKLQIGFAARFEDYSDFGQTVTGKVSARYDFTDSIALRGAISSGFRAPGLQQTSFTSTATNFINGIPTDILTTPAATPLAAQFGAKPLDPETADNYSLGAVLRFGNLVTTVDAYQINITDRIVLSDNLQGAIPPAGTPTQQIIYGLIQPFSTTATAVRFFINGVDTETKGLDVVSAYKIPTDTLGTFTVTATANWNKTDVTRTPTTAQLSALPVPPILFPAQRVLEFERGTPGYKASLGVEWTGGRFGATVRGTEYGGILEPQAAPNTAATWRQSAAFLLDAEARVKFDKFGFALGANNVLDEYPTKRPDRFNNINVYTNGAQGFSSYSPFGFNGRFVYGKVSYAW